MDIFFQFLLSIIYTIPFLLTYLAGLVFGLTNYRKMPKPALLALIGCALLLINELISISYSGWFFFLRGDADIKIIGWSSSIIRAFSTIFGVAGFIFLLAAIFTKRDNPPQN